MPFAASYKGYKLDISSFSLIVDRLCGLHTVIQNDDLPVTCCHFLKTHRNRFHIVLSSSKDSGKSVACAIFFSIAIPKSFALLGCSLGRQVFVPYQQLKFSRTLDLIQSFNRHAGGKLLPIHSLKWNQNDVFTASIVIIRGLASGFVYRSCALRHKPNINGFEKEENHSLFSNSP